MQQVRVARRTFSDSLSRLNQKECRILQEKLDCSNVDQYNSLFNYLHQNFTHYSTDQFGNYVCQKLYEYACTDQRIKILLLLQSDIFPISCNQYGTRVIQSIIATSEDYPLRTCLIQILKPYVLKMCINQHSCHVIQKCLANWKESEKAFIYDIVKINCFEICTNRWGCCIYQRCIDYVDEFGKLSLAQSVNSHLFDLMQDAYGNYAVQYILDLEIALLTHSIVERLIEDRNADEFSILCCQKFSSNVIEKCIRISNRMERTHFIQKMILNVDNLLEDAFGNYVLQTAVDFADEFNRECLYSLIDKKMSKIQHLPHGKKLYSKIHREIKSLSDSD